MRVEFDIENPREFIREWGNKMKFADNEPYCQYSTFIDYHNLCEASARCFGLFEGSGDTLYISADTPFTILDITDDIMTIQLESSCDKLKLEWKLNNPFDVRL